MKIFCLTNVFFFVLLNSYYFACPLRDCAPQAEKRCLKRCDVVETFVFRFVLFWLDCGGSWILKHAFNSRSFRIVFVLKYARPRGFSFFNQSLRSRIWVVMAYIYFVCLLTIIHDGMFRLKTRKWVELRLEWSCFLFIQTLK